MPRRKREIFTKLVLFEWKENEAPFYQVATIHIPKQSFDTPEQNQFCENLSFTPWHALPEHKPL
ncbi:catalase domain protein, partial [Acinetobacter baumannii 42057_5]